MRNQVQSFRRKPESSDLSSTPAFSGVTKGTAGPLPSPDQF